MFNFPPSSSSLWTNKRNSSPSLNKLQRHNALVFQHPQLFTISEIIVVKAMKDENINVNFSTKEYWFERLDQNPIHNVNRIRSQLCNDLNSPLRWAQCQNVFLWEQARLLLPYKWEWKTSKLLYILLSILPTKLKDVETKMLPSLFNISLGNSVNWDLVGNFQQSYIPFWQTWWSLYTQLLLKYLVHNWIYSVPHNLQVSSALSCLSFLSHLHLPSSTSLSFKRSCLCYLVTARSLTFYWFQILMEVNLQSDKKVGNLTR